MRYFSLGLKKGPELFRNAFVVSSLNTLIIQTS